MFLKADNYTYRLQFLELLYEYILVLLAFLLLQRPGVGRPELHGVQLQLQRVEEADAGCATAVLCKPQDMILQLRDASIFDRPEPGEPLQFVFSQPAS